MPVDFERLFSEVPWVFKTENEESWNVFSYSPKSVAAVVNHTKKKKFDANFAIRAGFLFMLKRESTDKAITQKEIDSFSTEDLESLACEFLDHNTRLVDGLKPQLMKDKGQKCTEYLVLVFHAYVEQQFEAAQAMEKDLRSRLGFLSSSNNPDIQSAAERMAHKISEDINPFGSSTMANSFANLTGPHESATSPIPEHLISRNPFADTNNQLAAVNSRLDDLRISAMEYLEIFSNASNQAKVASEKTANSAKIAISISVVAVTASIFVAGIQIAYTELWRVPRDTATMDFALSEIQTAIDDLPTALSISLTESEFTKLLRKNGEENAIVLQGIQEFLQRQQVRDQDVSDVLNIILGSMPEISR
jgi:hypothetical protein